MQAATLYGIANCDTIRQARAWLQQHGVDHEFHDYRKHGLDAELLERLAGELGWEAMLNRRGTTWRKLPEALRDRIDRESALRAMLDQPALIRRPILEHAGRCYLGFSPGDYEELFFQS